MVFSIKSHNVGSAWGIPRLRQQAQDGADRAQKLGELEVTQLGSDRKRLVQSWKKTSSSSSSSSSSNFYQMLAPNSE